MFIGINMGVTGSHGASFSPQAIVLEGDNYITRAALTGLTATRFGSFSFWFAPTADNTTFRTIKTDNASRVKIELDSSKRLRVTVSDGIGSFIFRTVSQVVPTDGESHYAITYDTNAAAGAKIGTILRDGVSDVEIFSDTAAAFTPPVNVTQAIGATTGGASICGCTLKEFMWWPTTYINWSDAATLAKVYAAGAEAAVYPGDSGELVTGTSPALYLSLRGESDPSTFLVNRGTGGDYTQASGTPTIRADMPFIPYGNSIVFGTGATSSPVDTWVYKTTRGLNTKRRRFNYGVGGESATAIRLRFVAAIAGHVAEFPKAVYCLEAGYNSIDNGSASIINDANLMIQSMLSAQPGGKWFFLGIPNGHLLAEGIGTDRYNTLTAANAGIEAIAGARFLDIRTWLIANGLAAAGLTATADDTTDIANGIVPRSLRSPDGSVHHNNFGQIAVGVAVREKLQALGYD